ncbi:hypothetical protein [Parasphingorhabdus sp.]|uniref:hypothetical protein n=1 Tax=Parasphingorhabdus sp. TaxID=2709688 RepID=UPI003267BD9F
MKMLPPILISAFATPAMGCGTITENWKFKNSDMVVNGNMHCDSNIQQCHIRFTKTLKQKHLRHVSSNKLSIYIPYEEEKQYREWMEKENMISCPPNGLWIPEKEKHTGTFFLKRHKSGKYQNIYYPDLESENY